MKVTDLRNFAITSGDIGRGMANAASALALAGNSIDESIAMIVAMSEITQDASGAGNAIKVLSMRLRGKFFQSPPYKVTYMLCA